MSQPPKSPPAAGAPSTPTLKVGGSRENPMQAALQACVDVLLHDGVPTDPEHPKRIALIAAEAALASRPDAQVDERGAFQSRVQPWMLACFGAEIAADTVERNHRFFEEAAELVQSCGMTASEAHQLVDYTWSRPVGEKTQEVGGVMVTLAALCLANGLDMHAAGETELARISAPETMAKIRAKQAAKPKHSPLPEARAAAPQAPQADERYDLLQAAVNCPHEIESNRVVLHYSDKQPGHNALAQLRERLARTAAPQAEAAQGVADGWKLVPIEPTVEMKIAGDNAAFWCGEKWKAMLSAAPAPVSEPEQPPAENAAVRNKIAAALHYPEHWDDTAYPTLDHAAWEAIATSKLACSECAEQPVEANVSIYVDCYECRECGHVGINDAHPTDAACGYPCGWSGPSPVEDKCPGCGKTNVMSSACPKCSGLYRMIAEAHIDSTSEQPSERGERPIEPEDIDAVAEAIQRETSVEWLIASRAAVAAIDTLIARGNHASEHGEQDCPHGVDDGACKQCYGEAVRGSCPDGSVCEIGCFGECEKRAASAPTLEPVHGDVLPAIGEQVLIHLARADVWEPHTVIGYYAWPDLRGDSFLQRVFVRVRHSDGTMNARMLRDIRRPDGSHYVKPTVKLPAPQPQAAEPKEQEEQPSFTNPLTPYGMLVRALRIVTGTTLYDMAKALLTTSAKLSSMEFGRIPVAQEFIFDVSAYFDALGVPDTLAALKVAANARALLANGE